MYFLSDPEKTIPPTVILTGPTRGLGLALFNQLQTQAFPIIALGRHIERIADLAIGKHVEAHLIELDLSADPGILTSALAEVRHILSSNSNVPLAFISNASIIEPIGQATGLVFSGLERAMRINCIAPLTIASFLTKIAKLNGRPLLILDVSSGAACRPIRGWQAYCTSKAAYKMGLDVLAAENPHIQVVHFDPGVMDTPMQELIRAQKLTDMPDVEVFRAFREGLKLRAPLNVAAEIIQLIKHHFS